MEESKKETLLIFLKKKDPVLICAHSFKNGPVY